MKSDKKPVAKGSQFLRFLFFGVLLTAGSFGLFSLLVFSGSNPYFAILVSFLVFTTIRFLTYRHLVFEETIQGSKSIIRFIITTVSLVLSNNVLFWLLNDLLTIGVYTSQFFVIGFLSVVSFFIQRRYVF